MSTVPNPAARYAQFRTQVFDGVVAEPALAGWTEPMPEMQLQSLWFSGEFGSEFTSTRDRRVAIRDFGIWNAGAGPDFSHCTVVIDGQQLTGDVELDPDVRDWERHGHGANSDYNQVVLHVFIHEPQDGAAFTRTAEHREVVQVRLTPEMLTDGFASPRRVAPARLGRCAQPLLEMTTAQVESLLEAAAWHRLQRKGRRLHQSVTAHGREQAIYQALAQALGYRSNQRPFTALAQRLPLRRLLPMERTEREALLFGVAGFLDATPFDQARDATRVYLRDLWEHWWKQRGEFHRWREVEHGLPWKIVGTRPGNHPQRRLGALAALLDTWQQVCGPLKRADAWNRKRWSEVMTTLHHPFWEEHYTLAAHASKKPVAMIGDSRLNEILANVAYPLLLQERPSVWEEYLELPAQQDNQKVRTAALRLFGTGPEGRVFQKKLHQQQGLLQLYEDFCLEDDSACAGCPFPERLKQWRV